jgi:hypothetical protein
VKARFFLAGVALGVFVEPGGRPRRFVPPDNTAIAASRRFLSAINERTISDVSIEKMITGGKRPVDQANRIEGWNLSGRSQKGERCRIP